MYWTLEYRMHICRSLSALNELRNEGVAYFTNNILNIADPHGFHLDYKWDREYIKKSSIFSGGPSADEGFLQYNGENIVYNGTNITFNS